MEPIQIQINGRLQHVVPSVLSELLNELQINRNYLAVAINNAVIPSADYNKTQVKNGDCIEIIQPVSGG